MPYIYKITNQINGKMYIGQTSLTVELRWSKHCSEYRYNFDRPLYAAMRKYGTNSFIVETLEECKQEEVCLKEQYWISLYNTYNLGYNATIGGEGKPLYDYSALVEAYEDLKSQEKVAELYGCHHKTVSDALKTMNKLVPQAKVVYQFSKEGEFIKSYPSVREAARALGDVNRNGKISNVCNNKRKTAYGYKWSYNIEDIV